MTSITLHLFRHGKVDGHRGDVPLAADAHVAIDAAASSLIASLPNNVRVAFLATRTRRSGDTASGIRDRLSAARPDLSLANVQQEYAIRNPDLYLAGHRVEMVSNGDAMAAQLPAGTMAGDAVEALPFFGGFFNAPDRIRFWLTHEDPPGEDAGAVARRIIHFCKSLGDVATDIPLHVVAVTHSPVMRAVLVRFMCNSDPGEPGWVEPINIELSRGSGVIRFRGDERSLNA